MNFPALVFWALIVWSVAASRGTALVLLLASMPFASLALLPPGAVGGMSILPQSAFAVVLIIKVLTPQVLPLSQKLLTALRFRHLGYLALFWVVGIVVTVIMPRFFVGDVVIIPMRELYGAELLSPIQANFTQSGYVTLSVLTVFAVTLMADELGFAETLLAGVLAGGIVCIATGLIDIAAASTGMESWLEPFRNAGYAYLLDAEIGGARRVVGFTPEASGYGNICVQFAAAAVLLRNLYAEGRQRVLATIVAVGLVMMALLSRSSTAYGGLAVLGLAYAINLVRRAVLSSPLGQIGLLWEILAGFGLVVAVLFILVARAELLDPLLNLINELIFNKPLTGSFYERSYWNTVAWDTVASTWGLGVGFGSTRTSNGFAAIISNAGLIAAAFMGIFLLQTFAKRLTWRTSFSVELLSALKLSLLPALAMYDVAAPGPDFGPWIAVVFGAITGIAALGPVGNSVRRVAADRPVTARIGGRRAIGSRAVGRITPPAPQQDSGPDKPAPRPSFRT